ncbi:hypothetical protein CM15mP43_04190 [bacterium]|nr:MAG: hypothetical protein CM15mP43_04190 [bacterium]
MIKNIQKYTKIVKERDRINITLKSYDKFKVYPSDSNFIFIRYKKTKVYINTY